MKIITNTLASYFDLIPAERYNNNAPVFGYMRKELIIMTNIIAGNTKLSLHANHQENHN